MKLYGTIISFFVFIMLNTQLLFALPYPVIREGWPVILGDSWSYYAFNRVSVFISPDGEPIIANSTNAHLALLDLDGNMLEGWPVTSESVEDNGCIVQGPKVGDMDGDGNLEIVVCSKGNNWLFQMRVYNINGQLNDTLTFSSNSIQGGPSPNAQPVLVDIDDNGDDELFFIFDSLYAIDEDGHSYPGFPWDLNDSTGFLTKAPPIVCIGEGWYEEESIVIWGTKSKIHARAIGSESELHGWPIDVEISEFCSAITVIPREDGWIVTLVDENYLYAWNQDGQVREGFPVENPDFGNHVLQSWDVVAGDIDGDGNPELLFKPLHEQLNIYTLDGERFGCFPISLSNNGSGEPPVIMRDGYSNLAVIFGASYVPYYSTNLYATRSHTMVFGFPIELPSVGRLPHNTNVALIPPDSDTLHIVHATDYGDVHVVDWPLMSTTTHFEWQQPGNNAGGNRMYSPNTYVKVDEDTKILYPENVELGALYPNPGNSFFKMEMVIPSSGKVKIEIFDVLGRQVYQRIIKDTPGKVYHWSWNTRDKTNSELPSGIYFIKVFDELSKISQMKKAILMR